MNEKTYVGCDSGQLLYKFGEQNFYIDGVTLDDKYGLCFVSDNIILIQEP